MTERNREISMELSIRTGTRVGAIPLLSGIESRDAALDAEQVAEVWAEASIVARVNRVHRPLPGRANVGNRDLLALE